MLAGYETNEVGILLEGSITALKNTPDGSSVAITEMSTGGLFGDVLSGSSTKVRSASWRRPIAWPFTFLMRRLFTLVPTCMKATCSCCRILC